MASPFKFFRKHQAGMMVVLVILAMLVFTLDALFTQQGANFWLLGLLIGGLIFGVAGLTTGRWLQWGIGGALLGTLLGLLMPEFNRPDGVLATSFGIIEQEDLQDLSERRMVANQFMGLATEEALGNGSGRFARQFGFGQPTREQDLLFSRLMHEEANALGIVVTDEMVTEYVNKNTFEKLSREAFGKARRALMYQRGPVRSEVLYDILREHIRNEIAYRTLVPDGSVAPPSPAVYWDYFQRMNVRQAIDVAELDVDAFLDQVDDPSDAEVEKMFASAAGKRPNQDEPGSAGFLLPGRAAIAWLELDYDSMKSTVPSVTDEEIETYYTENREIEYSTIVLPEKTDTDGKSPSELDDTPGDQTPIGVPPGSDADPATQNDDDESSNQDTSDTAGNTDQPLPEETKNESATEEDTTAVPETPADNAPADPDQNGGQFSIDDPVDGNESTVAEDQQTGAEGESAENTDSVEETGTPATSETPPALVIPKEPNAESSSEDSATEPVREYRKLDEELRNEIHERLLDQHIGEAIDQKIAEGLSFLQSLQSERNNERAKIVENGPQKFAEDPQAAEADVRREMAETTSKYLERMKTYAAENGFTYAVTPRVVSYLEFSNADDYPLGVAVRPGSSAFQARGGTDSTAYEVFSRFSPDDIAANNTQLFQPQLAVDSPLVENDNQRHYVYWVVEFFEPHVPATLDEPGVREQVVLSIKRVQARELLTKRAEQLAQMVRDGLAKADEARTSMASTLELQSITGEDETATLTVRTSQEFSWLRQTQTPPTSFQANQPRVELSTIRFADGISTLTGIDNEFMETVFEDMNDDEVGIVPNFDRTRYFLVHVTGRFPTEDSGMDGLHERFAAEGKMNFSRTPVMGLTRGNVVNPVIVEWERAIWRKYDVDPDADAG
ncbi:MAG: hypothetical protein MK110_02440 [Fuerstiella sp.]|nr:hypothetical protein [Fuerstiella sp.]